MSHFDPVMARAFQEKDYDTVKSLLDNGFDLTPIPGRGTYLDHAWSYRQDYSFDIVKLLIEHGEDLNYPGHPAITNAKTIEEIQYVLDRGADINAVTHVGVSALWMAACDNKVHNAQFLIDKGIDMARHGGPALQMAASRGHLDMAKLLVNADADVDYHTFDQAQYDSFTPLHHAAAQGHLPMVEYLLEAGASTRLKDCFGDRASHLAKALKNHDIAALIARYEPVELHNYDARVSLLKRWKLPKAMIQDLDEVQHKVQLPGSKYLDAIAYCSVYDVTELTFKGIRLLNLLADAGSYAAHGMLVWIPSMKALGTYNAEQETLALLPKVTWKAFRKSPQKYIDRILDNDYEPVQMEEAE